MTVLIREELVNRTDKNERKIFVRSLLDALNLRNISICGGDQLTIFYAESDNKTYLKYKNSLSRRLFSTLSRTNLGKRFYSTATKASDFVFKFINLVFPILETDINLTKLTNKFFLEVKGLKFVSVIANVKLINGNRFSLGARYPLDASDPDSQLAYIDYLNNKYALLDSRYKAVSPEDISFNYTQLNEELFLKSKVKFVGKSGAAKVIDNIDFRNEVPSNLPLNMDYATWGYINKWLDSKTLQVGGLNMDIGSIFNRHVKVTRVNNKTIYVKLISLMLVSILRIDTFNFRSYQKERYLT